MVEEARKKTSELPPSDQMSAYKGAAGQVKTRLDESGATSKQIVQSLAWIESDMLKGEQSKKRVTVCLFIDL